jgi:hypothetical protein
MKCANLQCSQEAKSKKKYCSKDCAPCARIEDTVPIKDNKSAIATLQKKHAKAIYYENYAEDPKKRKYPKCYL